MKYEREFHINIVKAAHNAILFSIMTYLADALKERLWKNLKGKSWNALGRLEKYIQQHTEIPNAVKKRDSKDASRRMYNHLAAVEEDLVSEQRRY